VLDGMSVGATSTWGERIETGRGVIKGRLKKNKGHPKIKKEAA